MSGSMATTTKQVERWYRRLVERATLGGGWQAYGYDMATVEAVRPGFTAAYRRLRSMWCEAEARENPA